MKESILSQLLIKCPFPEVFEDNIVNKERSARTGGTLQYPHPIRAIVLKRSNCRVQNRARGSLRGRGLHPAYSIVHIKILPSEGAMF